MLQKAGHGGAFTALVLVFFRKSGPVWGKPFQDTP
jgi:hypothetical protein